MWHLFQASCLESLNSSCLGTETTQDGLRNIITTVYLMAINDNCIGIVLLTLGTGVA